MYNKHVFEDLQPYVCTNLNCVTAHELYATRLHHTKMAHPRTPTAYNADEESGSKINCPLCKESLESEKRYARHVARHLQELALFVLPRSEEEQEVSDQGYGTRAGSSVGSASRPGSVDSDTALHPESDLQPNIQVDSKRGNSGSEGDTPYPQLVEGDNIQNEAAGYQSMETVERAVAELARSPSSTPPIPYNEIIARDDFNWEQVSEQSGFSGEDHGVLDEQVLPMQKPESSEVHTERIDLDVESVLNAIWPGHDLDGLETVVAKDATSLIPDRDSRLVHDQDYYYPDDDDDRNSALYHRLRSYR
jgi:hypothetical protein